MHLYCETILASNSCVIVSPSKIIPESQQVTFACLVIVRPLEYKVAAVFLAAV